MSKWARATILVGAIPGVAVAIYILIFFGRFHVFGSPVRDNEHGWLGPALRGDSQVVDIGKVYYYEGTDFAAYRTFRPLCRLWIWTQGL